MAELLFGGCYERQFHRNDSVMDPNRKSFQACGRVGDHLAGNQIEFLRVQGADNYRTANHAVGERSATMRALISYREKPFR
jgi:hypothetical protein